MSGTIQASDGNIGDFQIIDGKISGSNITFDANNSSIFKTDQGPGSDTSAAFDQLRNEYYIDFTPSSSTDPEGTEYYIKMGPNFMVDKSGILIASGAFFEGSVSASAGFLGGLIYGKSIEDCVKAGNFTAKAIIQQAGCTFPDSHSFKF